MKITPRVNRPNGILEIRTPAYCAHCFRLGPIVSSWVVQDVPTLFGLRLCHNISGYPSVGLCTFCSRKLGTTYVIPDHLRAGIEEHEMGKW